MIYFKRKPDDKVEWVDNGCYQMCFTFDRKKLFYLPRDYEKLTPEQKEVFDKENPFWKWFFERKGVDDELQS